MCLKFNTRHFSPLLMWWRTPWACGTSSGDFYQIRHLCQMISLLWFWSCIHTCGTATTQRQCRPAGLWSGIMWAGRSQTQGTRSSPGCSQVSGTAEEAFGLFFWTTRITGGEAVAAHRASDLVGGDPTQMFMETKATALEGKNCQFSTDSRNCDFFFFSLLYTLFF